MILSTSPESVPTQSPLPSKSSWQGDKHEPHLLICNYLLSCWFQPLGFYLPGGSQRRASTLRCSVVCSNRFSSRPWRRLCANSTMVESDSKREGPCFLMLAVGWALQKTFLQPWSHPSSDFWCVSSLWTIPCKPNPLLLEGCSPEPYSLCQEVLGEPMRVPGEASLGINWRIKNVTWRSAARQSLSVGRNHRLAPSPFFSWRLAILVINCGAGSHGSLLRMQNHRLPL